MKNVFQLVVAIVIVSAFLAVLRFYVLAPKVVHAKGIKESVKIGYLPVTCHLTCPVTDYASKTTATSTLFESTRFTDFPTVSSALQSKKIMATFMLAPLALKLKEDGVPVKICYLGHRDGSQLIVAKSSTAKSLQDLKGKKIAVPSIYSNQHLVLQMLLEQQNLPPNFLEFVPLPPPDMPAALAAKAIDGYFVGEPFCAKAEIENIGRVLYYSRDIWPNFISCVLVVHEDLIQQKPQVVRDLVRGIAESGAWAEIHRSEAAKVAATYYRQDAKLLNYVLTSKPNRVSYVRLTPDLNEMEKIAAMGRKVGLLKKSTVIADVIDNRFIPEHVLPASIPLVK